MKPPVRVVCGECLRSLELVPEESGRLPALCPVCGGTIDSQFGDLETPTANFDALVHVYQCPLLTPLTRY